jgi:hypothetical protein
MIIAKCLFLIKTLKENILEKQSEKFYLKQSHSPPCQIHPLQSGGIVDKNNKNHQQQQ